MRRFNWKKGDYLLASILFILFLSSLIYPVWRFLQPRDQLVAIIRQENEILQTIDLTQVSEPYEFTIYHGVNQQQYNIIEVAPGKIRVEEAYCREQIDVLVSWLTRADDLAVWLPHRLILELKGTHQGEIDIIAR